MVATKVSAAAVPTGPGCAQEVSDSDSFVQPTVVDPLDRMSAARRGRSGESSWQGRGRPRARRDAGSQRS
ncbi:hypothetical protein GS506_09340 [Rhodococcus hoagii]|nr:hypothetical protein [Prescottella equi]